MICKICESATVKIHSEIILNKYETSYYKCGKCYFIQTDKPIWLEEAYNSAITDLDIGLLQRNLYLLEKVPRMIDVLFPEAENFIDFGGGYGVFVRLMRDRGFNFFRYDIYCENLFAKHFDYDDSKLERFDILTCFEVFEHLEEPIDEIKKMLKLSDTIIFSTHLIPESNEEFKKWWYVAPETGQHIAFYHRETFLFMADLLNCHYYTNNIDLHVLTYKKFDVREISKAFRTENKTKFYSLFGKQKMIERSSLLESDFQFVRSLNKKGA